MPTAKQDKTRKNGLTVKDLIVMGVFGALLMVCSMIGGVLFAVTPTLTFYFSIGAALLPGPVFLLLNISRHENHRYTFEIHQYT